MVSLCTNHIYCYWHQYPFPPKAKKKGIFAAQKWSSATGTVSTGRFSKQLRIRSFWQWQIFHCGDITEESRMMQGTCQWSSTMGSWGLFLFFKMVEVFTMPQLRTCFMMYTGKTFTIYRYVFQCLHVKMIVLRLKLRLLLETSRTILMMCKQMSLSKGASSGSTLTFQGVLIFDHKHGWHRKPYYDYVHILFNLLYILESYHIIYIWFPHEEKCRLAGVLAATRQGDTGSTCRSSWLSCRSYDQSLFVLLEKLGNS